MSALLALLALVGEPALAVGSAGACHGSVVAPGVVVLEACSLAQLMDASVYVEPSEEPLSGFEAHAGRKPGRVILTFTLEHVQ